MKNKTKCEFADWSRRNQHVWLTTWWSTFDSYSGHFLEYIVLGYPKLKSVNNQWVASSQLGFLIPKILYLDCLVQII